MGEKDTVRHHDKHFHECAAPRRTTLTLERHAATAAVRLRIKNPGQRTLHALMEALSISASCVETLPDYMNRKFNFERMFITTL